MPHNPLGPICTTATVHLAAAVPNFSWLECRASPVEQLGFDSRELFPQQAALVGSHYQVPDGPGLGVEVNEDALTKHEFQFFEPPHLRRRDGSFTNW
jgi:galactonate dehydratase